MNDRFNNQLHNDVCEGLRKTNKSLPCKYFYDELGSEIFDKICLLEEYYPTRTEISILENNIENIQKYLINNLSIFEFGAGSVKKIKILLDNLSIKNYIPIDISFEYLKHHSKILSKSYKHININPLYGDFTDSLTNQNIPINNYINRIGFFPGSTIGNFEPSVVSKLLKNFGNFLGKNSKLIIGIDLIKNKKTLLNAYNDKEGLTAKFNLNILSRLNRELNANFNIKFYKHTAIYNELLNRIEMHIISLKNQSVYIDNEKFYFREKEIIHTENSYKYSLDGFIKLVKNSGFTTLDSWTDDNRFFSILLLNYDL
ncbi:MAG: Histidine N-alpha-methyltransferase [Alphaproteobacteria bacterium MarineAlpha2_Bin1]|nr:MAG: Histidine N-alpha-methyltransferase [Alphaproteobacteria bacterium MarineAlpha2_Bin1]